MAFNHMCPLCSSELRRTWRRPVERFTSLFLPLHRYRCGNFSCQWEGNFRVHALSAKGAVTPAAARPASKPVSQKLPALVASACALVGVLVVILVGSQWPTTASWAGSAATREDSVAATSVTPSVNGQEIPVGPRRGPGSLPP